MKSQVIKANPTTPSQRFLVKVKFNGYFYDHGEDTSHLKSKIKNSSRGRDNHGRITSRFIGGGHKKKYRKITMKWSKEDFGSWFEVVGIEYDPNRNLPIALIKGTSGSCLGSLHYILLPESLSVGSKIYVNETFIDNNPGSVIPIKNIPTGVTVSCIELKPHTGAKFARSAGASVQISGSDGDYVIVRLPSGETRKIHGNCLASLGQLSNKEFINRSIGKAGRSRWLGRRPHVRGVAMNPVDHPHGGGEGKTSGGRHPVNPFGRCVKGKKTRVNKRTSKYIISRRKKV